MMYGIDYFKQEQREQGKKEAKLEIALKLIKRGLDIKDVSEDTGISIVEIKEEIEKLKRGS